MTEYGKKRCSNCGHDMEYVGREDVQLGRTSFILGDWPNLLAGALNVEIWECPDCGKLDLYRGDASEKGEGQMAKTTCPVCGVVHELDDSKCPRCGMRNPNI